MAVDPYAMCPCGSGKKLKFCCSDLVGEIEKIHRMIEGEQPRAALRHVEQTLATHPGRASLLGSEGDARNVARRNGRGPRNGRRSSSPRIATARRPMRAKRSCWPKTTSRARRSIRCSGRWRWSSAKCRSACSRRSAPSAARCWKPGTSWRAQAHLWLHAALAPKDDTRSREVLAALNHYSGLPLLLRDQLRFRPWPRRRALEGRSREGDAAGRQRQMAAKRSRSSTNWASKYGADPDAGVQPRTARRLAGR